MKWISGTDIEDAKQMKFSDSGKANMTVEEMSATFKKMVQKHDGELFSNAETSREKAA